MFGDNCDKCHESTNKKKFLRHITKNSCEKCHKVSSHFLKDKNTIECHNCHVEHQGAIKLANVNNLHCIQCHNNLNEQIDETIITNGDTKKHKIPKQITNFANNHPDFKLIKTNIENISLNHNLHLSPNLMGLRIIRDKSGITQKNGQLHLTCIHCHKTDKTGAYMEPITFEIQCSDCHEIRLDRRVPNVILPHKKIESLIPIMRERYAEYVLENMEKFKLELKDLEEGKEGDTFYLSLPEKFRLKVEKQIKKRIKSLEKINCILCHTKDSISYNNSDSKIIPIKKRWFLHSKFNHKSHRALMCISCHETASQSEISSDVLIPEIESCRQCHGKTGGARSDCVLCHNYHMENNIYSSGGFNINEFID